MYKNASSREGIILVILILTLALKYFLFILGAHVTSIPVLCGINSGLLQYINIVFFSWTMIHSLRLYLILFSPGGKRRTLRKIFIMIGMILSWSKLLMTCLCGRVEMQAFGCGINMDRERESIQKSFVIDLGCSEVTIIIAIANTKINKMRSFTCTALPLLIVTISAAVWSNHYVNAYL